MSKGLKNWAMPKHVDEYEEDEEDDYGADSSEDEVKPMDMEQFNKELEQENDDQEGSEDSTGPIDAEDMEYYNDPENSHKRARTEPHLEAFNLKEEVEVGQYDETGNYVLLEHEKDEIDLIDNEEMKKVQKAENERLLKAKKDAREKRSKAMSINAEKSIATLLESLEPAETGQELLQRLYRDEKKYKRKRDVIWRDIHKQIGLLVDTMSELEQLRYEINGMSREELLREYHKLSGEEWKSMKRELEDE